MSPASLRTLKSFAYDDIVCLNYSFNPKTAIKYINPAFAAFYLQKAKLSNQQSGELRIHFCNDQFHCYPKLHITFIPAGKVPG